VLSYFPLFDQTGKKVLQFMVMIRDPYGPQEGNAPNTQFNPWDTLSWTEQFKAQVPHGIDPLDLDYFK
jgi:hypothetical protein